MSAAVEPTEPAGRWTFLPRPRPWGSRDDPTRLRRGIDAALRAGHGAGASFRLHVGGGGENEVDLSVDDRMSGRWAERVLFAAYEPGEWRRSSPSPLPSASVRWVGHRRSLPGERPTAPVEGGRLLRALGAALRTTGPGATMTLGLRPAPRSRWRGWEAWWPSSQGRAATGRPAEPPGSGGPRRLPRPIDPSSGLAWQVSIQVEIGPPSRGRAPAAALVAVRSAWTALDGQELALREGRTDRAPRDGGLLSIEEVPALLPADELDRTPASQDSLTASSVPIGRSANGTTVTLPVEPGQGRHFAVLGETGMGKSALLVAVARRAARIGGVVLLDPLGETASALRAELEADGRAYLWIAPGDPGVQLNALAGIGRAIESDPVRAERELENLVHALRRVRAGRYVDSAYWGPRLEEMLLRALRAAAAIPGGTLADAHALLAGSAAGRTVVPLPAREAARELAGRVRERPEDAEGARRLLYEIVRNPTLAAMLCAAAPTLTVPRLVEPGRLVLVSGAAGVVGESTARYLLATYLTLLWSELLGRPSAAKTFVLLDEAQWFATEALGEMLRLARRRDVHVGVATQGLASLPEAVRDAVRTNVADLIVFRGGEEQAVSLGRTPRGASAEAWLGLSRGEAMVLLGKGEYVGWVRTAHLPSGPGASQASFVKAGVPQRLERAAAGERPPLPPEPLPDPLASADGSENALLPELLRRVTRLPRGALLPVDVGAMRARGVLNEAELRAWGGTLGRQGALVRREVGERGPVWWIDPEALAPDRRARPFAENPAVAGSQKRL